MPVPTTSPGFSALLFMALGAGTMKAGSPSLNLPLASPRGLVLAPEVVREISEARQNPSAYASNVRRLLGHFQGKLLVMPGRVGLRTKEGEAAVLEAITFLEKQKPLAGLSFSQGLALAAKDHAGRQGPTGEIGHAGPGGTTMVGRVQAYGRFGGILGEEINYGGADARTIVVSLIIDDGVPDRGHRKNIFNPRYKVAGAAIGPHAVYQYMCVVDFAETFTEK